MLILIYSQLRAFEKLLIDYPEWRGNVPLSCYDSTLAYICTGCPYPSYISCIVRLTEARTSNFRACLAY